MQISRKSCTARDWMVVQKVLTPMTRWTPPQADPCSPSSPVSKLGNLTTLGSKRRKRRRALDSINIHYYIYLEGAEVALQVAWPIRLDHINFWVVINPTTKTYIRYKPCLVLLLSIHRGGCTCAQICPLCIYKSNLLGQVKAACGVTRKQHSISDAFVLVDLQEELLIPFKVPRQNVTERLVQVHKSTVALTVVLRIGAAVAEGMDSELPHVSRHEVMLCTRPCYVSVCLRDRVIYAYNIFWTLLHAPSHI